MFKLFTGSALIRASGAVAQVVMTLVITRVCGVRQAGIVFFGYSLIMMVSTLTRAGTELSALRAISHAHDAGDQRSVRVGALSRLLFVGTVSSVCSVAAAVAAPWIARVSVGTEAVNSLRWAAIAIPAFALLGLLSELLKGIQRAWIGLLVQNVATPLLVVPLVLLGRADSAPVVSAILCGSAWTAALLTLAYWRGCAGACSAGELVSGRVGIAALLRDVPTLLAVTAAPVLMQWMGAALLGFLTTPSQVAGYSVAARLAIAVSVVHSAASSVVAPRMAVAHHKGDLAGLQRVTMQTGLLIAAITGPILLALGVVAPTALNVFGSGYGEFAPALRVLLVGQIVASFIGHSGMVLAMTGKYAAARRNALFAVASLTGLTYVLVPTGGAMGAAVAMAGSVILGHLSGLVMVKRHVGIWTVPTSGDSLRDALRRPALPSPAAPGAFAVQISGRPLTPSPWQWHAVSGQPSTATRKGSPGTRRFHGARPPDLPVTSAEPRTARSRA